MAQLAVLEYPDPRLRTRAARVTVFGAPLDALIEDMLQTMYASKAIGLAATQVDVHQQIIVIDTSGNASDPHVFINPSIIARSGLGMVEEGCLSVPGVYDSVRRALRVTVRAVNRAGAEYERDLEGVLAVCLQHEMDHLDGKLFVDHLSWLRRLRARRVLARARREHAPSRVGTAAHP